jgi:hypothetical protein
MEQFNKQIRTVIVVLSVAVGTALSTGSLSITQIFPPRDSADLRVRQQWTSPRGLPDPIGRRGAKSKTQALRGISPSTPGLMGNGKTSSVGAAYPTNASVAILATPALPATARIPAMCLDDGPHLEGGILEWALTIGIKDSRHYWYHQRALADAYWAHYACPDAR